MTDPDAPLSGTVSDLRDELRERADVPVPDAPVAQLLARAEEIKRTRSRWTLIAVAASVVAVIGLGVAIAGTGGADDRVVPSGQPSSTTTDQPSDEPTTVEATADGFTVDLRPQSPDLTEADLGLVTDLVSIARVGVYDDPQLDAMKALVQDYPFADRVELRFGLTSREVARSDLVLPRNWESDTAGFGRDGVLSALDQVNLFISLSSDSNSTGPMKVFLGAPPRCGGGAPLRFPGREGLRQISFEPAHTASCLDWFSISLYQDAQGKVSAVTLDLYEP